ncbi:ACT domain-containing protein [Chitinivorax sp. B]|uniref:ACT domain-containing protein n=1 Tax=Chitinivorax sp. B TaxID=2502235 RepID=UPI0010F9F460|nr:ACT domain-containing protein [Chitinivorax sp. B]
MLTLRRLPDTFAIHRWPATSAIPAAALAANWFSITRTANELSLVLPSAITLPSEHVSTDWQALAVVGPLDFALTGILAGLSGVLAQAGISIFAISTYDTDILLIKADRMDAAIHALQQAGYHIESAPTPTALT